MESQRRKTVVSISEVQSQDGAGAWFRKYGNSILTGLLFAAAILLLIRWRLNSVELTKQGIVEQLHQAKAIVARFNNGNLAQLPPADLIKSIQATQAEANVMLANILNNSDSDAAAKAQARLLRGNLYWNLANLPEMPGASTQPALQLNETSDALLGKAFDEYTAVATTPEFADIHDAVNSARLGLAAVAENRNDWVTATKELQAVKNDPQAPSHIAEAANMQLDTMINVQSPIYVAPPQGISSPTTEPAASLPMGPFPTSLPSVLPALPATRPGH